MRTRTQPRTPVALLRATRGRLRLAEVELQRQARHGQHHHVATPVRQLLGGHKAAVALERRPRLGRGSRHRRRRLRVVRCEALRRLPEQQAIQRKALEAVARERGLHLR